MPRRKSSKCYNDTDVKVKNKRQDPVSTSSLIRMQKPDPPPSVTQSTATRRPPRRRSSTSDVNAKQSKLPEDTG